MKYLHCISCGKEKSTYGKQRYAICASCGKKGNTFRKGVASSEEAKEKNRIASTGKIQSAETKAKMSAAHMGIPKPIEVRQKISIAHGGDGTLTQWRCLKTWGRKVKQRDGHCYICLSTEKLEAHHILHKASFPDLANDLENGVALCHTCHIDLHRGPQ